MKRLIQILGGIAFFAPFGLIGMTEQGGSIGWSWAALGSMTLALVLLLINNKLEQKKRLRVLEQAASKRYSVPVVSVKNAEYKEKRYAGR